jgi:hypothetical protein
VVLICFDHISSYSSLVFLVTGQETILLHWSCQHCFGLFLVGYLQGILAARGGCKTWVFKVTENYFLRLNKSPLHWGQTADCSSGCILITKQRAKYVLVCKWVRPMGDWNFNSNTSPSVERYLPLARPKKRGAEPWNWGESAVPFDTSFGWLGM